MGLSTCIVHATRTQDINTYRAQLQQLIDTRRALEDTVTYKFSAEEVEGLRTKLRHLHDTLRGGQSRGKGKERQLSSFHDLIESIEEAEAEVCRWVCIDEFVWCVCGVFVWYLYYLLNLCHVGVHVRFSRRLTGCVRRV